MVWSSSPPVHGSQADIAVLLVGIAAGIRGKLKIGEVVLSDRVVAYEPAAAVVGPDGTSREEPRPEIDRLPYAMNQDVVSYEPDPGRLQATFAKIGGKLPAPPEGQEALFREHVATAVGVRTATIASGEKLLRDPSKLLCDVEVLVPNLAGWRVERMPELPEAAYFSLAPGWICEVLSSSTENLDREEKMPIYAREGVRHAWLVDPIQRTLEVHVLAPGRAWGPPVTYRDSARVRVEPFEALELDLSVLWAR
ncbi:Uma2 family endonuclease [Sorangium sp. So ce1335]|uniref:Uma2 family endonuclease n=1 Tax=Sorangium sp. So ce1335 TaxID=3133335 RepID=UPI003F5FB8B4